MAPHSCQVTRIWLLPMDDDEQLHERIVLLDREALTAWQERYAPAIIALAAARWAFARRC